MSATPARLAAAAASLEAPVAARREAVAWAASLEAVAAVVALVSVASGGWLVRMASVVWRAPLAQAAPRARQAAPRVETLKDVRDAEKPIARGATNSSA
jgi:hypothetical protein